MAPRLHSRITGDPLSVSAAHGFCADPAAGAVVVFTGLVRDHAEDRAVVALDYEADQERAERQLAALAEQVAAATDEIRAVWLEHRTGTLAVGEPSVVVAVAAAHRGQAFDAARAGIDELKATVAIWKREHWAAGGAHWVGIEEDRPEGGPTG